MACLLAQSVCFWLFLVYVCSADGITVISASHPDGVDKPAALSPSGLTETGSVVVIVNSDNPGSEVFVPMEVTGTVENANTVKVLDELDNVLKEVCDFHHEYLSLIELLESSSIVIIGECWRWFIHYRSERCAKRRTIHQNSG